MKTIQKTLAVFLMTAACLVNLPLSAFADMVQGEVTEIAADGSYLRIARNDPENNAAEPESVKVLVSSGTVYEELENLNELRPGDEIWADITFDEGTKTWSASKVRLDKVDIKAPGDAAAEKAASQSEAMI